eukprot:9691443-Lingulodinium_polyedra.AAC.1
MLKLGPVIEVLAELANDREACHTQDAAWARKVLPLLNGPAGFTGLVNFRYRRRFCRRGPFTHAPPGHECDGCGCVRPG